MTQETFEEKLTEAVKEFQTKYPMLTKDESIVMAYEAGALAARKILLQDEIDNFIPSITEFDF